MKLNLKKKETISENEVVNIIKSCKYNVSSEYLMYDFIYSSILESKLNANIK